MRFLLGRDFALSAGIQCRPDRAAIALGAKIGTLSVLGEWRYDRAPVIRKKAALRSHWRWLALCLLAELAWATACAPVAAGTLQGTAFYRERIALPPDAIFEALLQDISRADAAGEVLGRARLEAAGQPPFHFSISYDDAAIQPGRRYAVRASVTHQGRVLFTSDRSYPVFNGGNGPLTLLLVSARRARGPMQLMPQDENMRPLPVSREERGTLTGMFTYMADAATMTLCAGGRRLPVAVEADYKALAAAYRRAGPEPGQALLVSVQGSIESRPSAEESAPRQATLVVRRFLNLWPGETCAASRADTPLRGTYWKLVRLGHAPVQGVESQREPHLIFAADQPQVTGNGGCNSISGSFALDGDRLRFGHMASTMMACPNGMEQEQRFLQSLEKVERFRVSGGRLEVLDASGALIAQFEAVMLR